VEEQKLERLAVSAEEAAKKKVIYSISYVSIRLMWLRRSVYECHPYPLMLANGKD
jgi:hypothetical protein